MGLSDEIKEKERRVREFLRLKGLKALLLKRQANFSWVTGGGLNLVGIATEMGATSLLITENSKFVISNNIEAPRMIDEEGLGKQGFIAKTFPWHEDQEVSVIRELVGESPFGSDVPFQNAMVVTEDVARLRYSLTPEEQERYRWLGEKVSLALEKTLMKTKKGEKESEVVGRLCSEIWKDRIDPITLMGAADDRVAYTRPGVPAREVFQKGIDAYQEKGCPDEWKLHHQGGAIGYTGRDYRASFKTPDLVQENQAFTWNPSITGTKSEDTILATSKGPEMITKPILYPTLSMTVEGISFKRPAILVKKGGGS